MNYIRSIEKYLILVRGRVMRLFDRDVEVVVYSTSQITEQRIYYVPNIVDRVVGVDGQDKVSTGGINDAGVACVADDSVGCRNVSVFMRHEGPVWDTSLDQRAEFVLCHVVNDHLTGGRSDLFWKCSYERAAVVLRALIDICEQ